MHAPGALALSAFTAFGTASPASAEAMFMGLGDLPGGRVASFANAVSADGSVVVGHSSSALALGSAYEAFRWTAADGMIGLGDLPGGGAFDSRALSVSADGSVVVGRGIPPTRPFGNPFLGFRWEGGTMTSLGGPPGLPGQPPLFSEAKGVSADGTFIVGRGQRPLGGEWAYVWTAESGWVSLFGDEGGSSSGANAVSADGSVVVEQGSPGALRWTIADGMMGLGATSFSAFGVSADGSVVVGEARLEGARRVTPHTLRHTSASLHLSEGLRWSGSVA